MTDDWEQAPAKLAAESKSDWHCIGKRRTGNVSRDMSLPLSDQA